MVFRITIYNLQAVVVTYKIISPSWLKLQTPHTVRFKHHLEILQFKWSVTTQKISVAQEGRHTRIHSTCVELVFVHNRHMFS